MAVGEEASRLTKDAHSHMMSRHVDMDAIIAAARGRSQQNPVAPQPPNPSPASGMSEPPQGSSALDSSQGPVDIVGSHPSSPPAPPSTVGHRRVPSNAESLAESLKENENEGEAEPPTGVRRPEGQPREFGTDITQFMKEEKEREEADAANR